MRNRLPVLLLAFGASTAAACGKQKGTPVPRQPAYVVFVNQSLDYADVYVVAQGSANTRIGSVPGGRTETLRVQPSALGSAGQVDVVARLLAVSRAPRTGPFSLRPGERVQVTLPPAQNLLTILPVISDSQ